MGDWSIIIPESTINYVRNPSVENAITNWLAFGTATVTRSQEQARFGSWSLKVVADYSQGVSYRQTEVCGETSSDYVVSAYVYCENVISVRFKAYDPVGVAIIAYLNTVAGRWTRLSLKGVTLNNPYTTGLDVTLRNWDPDPQTFYVDGLQVELKTQDEFTTYCDGDQAGCRWQGVSHLSSSTRPAQEASGGRVYDIADDIGCSVLAGEGLGMPPISHNIQPMALQPQARHAGMSVQPRVLMLHLWANGTSTTNLHALRNALLDAVKPDRVRGNKAFILRYSGAGYDVDAACFYDGGLEYQQESGFAQEIILRLITTDPFWYEDNQQVAELDMVDTVIDSDQHIAKRQQFVWSNVGTGLNGNVEALLIASDGTLYVGGAFTTAGGVTVNCIAKWSEGDGWAALGDGFDDTVRGLAEDAEGNLYAVGDFIQDSTATNNYYRVAKWDGAAWSAMSDGFNGAAQEVAIGPDGTIYVGGQFSQTGGVPFNLRGIAYWTGSAWAELGNGVVSATVYTVAIDTAGNVYIGGSFTSVDNSTPVSANRIARWDGSAWSALGTGGDDDVFAIRVAQDGTLYAGGYFVQMGGNTSCRLIAKWNGMQWLPMGQGLNGTATVALVNDIAISEDGMVYVTGYFEGAGDVDLLDGLALWNGSSWVQVDVNLRVDYITVMTVALRRQADGTDDVFVGFDDVTNVEAAGKTDFTNSGSASAYPIFEFTGPGTLWWLENQQTRQRIYLNLEIQTGETVTLDLRPGRKTIKSSWRRRSLFGAILPASDWATFHLLPGANSILCYVWGTTGDSKGAVRWIPTHWSPDGVA